MAYSTDIPSSDIETVRHYNRFYTRQIGLLNEGLLNSEFSLTEARVLHDLAQIDQITASVLGQSLGLDPGYLSRIVKKFERRGFITRKPSPSDGRQFVISLTDLGEEAYAPLNQSSRDEIGDTLSELSPGERDELIKIMNRIKQILKPTAPTKPPYILRSPAPGDFGWIIHRQAALYHQEWGFDETFEALIAEIIGAFITNFNPNCERCWIAERNNHVVGSIFCVKSTNNIAKLRMLYVEPSARGHGIGAGLVDEVIKFARRKNYKTLKFWTNDILVSARRIYEASGFELVKETPHQSFGQALIGQDWQLTL